MIIINKIILLGRLSKNPDLIFAKGSGTAVCKFTVAVNRQFKRDEVDFINCIAFGKKAEAIAQYMLKGSQILLCGRIQTGSYDAQDGTKRYTTDVVVEEFNFVGGSKKQDDVKSNENFDDSMTPVDDGDMLPF